MNSELQPGAYPLPNNCRAFVRNGKVIVCQKCNVDDIPRCRDCRSTYWGNQDTINAIPLQYVKSNRKPIEGIKAPKSNNSKGSTLFVHAMQLANSLLPNLKAKL